MTSTHELLQFYFQRKRAKTPGLSIRSIATKLRISPSYFSRALRGQKPFPPKHLRALAALLEIDELGVRKIELTLLAERLPPGLSLPESKNTSENFEDAEFPTYALLDRWYQIALLDLISVRDFKPSSAWIAQRLRISREEAKTAWKNLRELRVIEKKDGRWKKASRFLHFPTQRTSPHVRRFHAQHLELAKKELENRTRPEDFARRLIAGSTMAVNPAQLPKAREILLKTMQEITSLLSEGECSEVYHLNLGLFALTEAR